MMMQRTALSTQIGQKNSVQAGMQQHAHMQQ